MSYTKRDLVYAALRELGLADYSFDMAVDQLDSALMRLDTMIAEWNGRGIRLGYVLPGDPADGNMNDQSGIPDWANEAVITNLAVRLAPSFGKTAANETRAIAIRSFNTVLGQCTRPTKMRLGTFPAGAGAKTGATSTPFVPQDDKPTIVRPADSVTLE